ncbi:MAG: flagellar hook-basal body complex protein FliE [Candidatus Anammoxibacter sp.]
MEISSITPGSMEHLKRQDVKKLEGNSNGVSFKNTLGSFVSDVNEMQLKADSSIEDFATGKITNIHEVMISMKKAEMSFQFLMETRNKLVEAYREVSRMQV